MTPTTRLRVGVASDQALVAESIRAALGSRGLDTLGVSWPGTRRPEAYVTPLQAARLGGGLGAALMIVELDRAGRLRAASRLLRIRIPWVVLADATTTPIWGALLELGAAVVAPSSITLDEAGALLTRAATGEELTTEAERQQSVAEWHTLSSAREQAENRVASMTPREREVLGLLWAGDSVRGIAARLEVSEATVRSQVKTVLRKLEVNSQLAAVAVLDSMRRGWPSALEAGSLHDRQHFTSSA
jgi:DNA-binding NarL/FixJ family response regulator